MQRTGVGSSRYSSFSLALAGLALRGCSCRGQDGVGLDVSLRIHITQHYIWTRTPANRTNNTTTRDPPCQEGRAKPSKPQALKHAAQLLLPGHLALAGAHDDAAAVGPRRHGGDERRGGGRQRQQHHDLADHFW